MLLYCFAIGCLILLFFILKYRSEVRIEWGSVAKFLSFMSLVTFIRIAIATLAPPSIIPEMQGFDKIDLASLPLVFWEDAFFVLPIVYLRKYFTWRVCIIPAIALSIFFGLSHAYQGIFAIFITTLYPMLVSYRYGLRYGFGTVMVCHILYDFITYFTVYFVRYVLPFI